MHALTIAILYLLGPTGAEADKPPLFEGTGEYERKVTTNLAEAQQYFDQGLNFMYAFNHDEAAASFRYAARGDPNCAMAWWGLAMVLGPNYNNPEVPPEAELEAWNAIQKARTAVRNGTAAEKALVAAAEKRYSNPPRSDRTRLNTAYADEMRRVWRANPNDADIGALFAESMMNLRPWDLWTKDGKPQPGMNEILSALEAAMKLQPNNPLANHLYIHAVEASPDPDRGTAAADRLLNLQPGLGHNVHMPSHIYVRTGQWKKAINSNELAIKADEAYTAIRPDQGFYLFYMAHNHHMLAYAAMMRGQKERTLRAVDGLFQGLPQEALKEMAGFLDGYMAAPIEARKRFGMWDEVLAMPDHPEYFPLARTLRRAARSVAHAAKGNVEAARGEQSMFYVARRNVPADTVFGNNSAHDVITVAHRLMNGEILLAEGRLDRAIEELNLAVKAEDALAYDEPPQWIQPTRHTLGAVLLEAGKYQEAIRVYREDLRIHPNNGWSFYGLSEALAKLGQTAEASRIRTRFVESWADADISISSSCLCIPGR